MTLNESYEPSGARIPERLLSEEAMLHELNVRQIELETQNQQLIDSQHELEEARDRYADLYDYAPVGYLTLDVSGRVLEINLTGADMLGKERLNAVNLPFVSLLTSHSIHPFLSHLRQVFSQPGNSVIEIKFKTKEGMPRLVRLESIAVPGDPPVCRTVMTDVTDQRELGTALQVVRSAQDALLNAIPALVFYLDYQFRFLSVSQTFADFVDRTPEGITGKTFFDFFPAEVADDFYRVFSSVLHSGIALYGFENNVSDVNGNLVSLSSVIAPFRDHLGNTIGLVGASIDVTTIKSISNRNSELLLQNRKLTRRFFEAQEEERRHLARELHDELGQWFTAIQAEAHVISNIASPESEIHDSALAISKSASEVHQVIRGMVKKLRPSLLDELGLADSLRELLRQWRHSHPDVACDLILNVPLEGLKEEVNLTIYRLVQEALNNVASHAKAKRVTISADLEAGMGKEDADLLSLTASDDGRGFDVNTAVSGIGLLGMRERVIASGGDFYVKSAAGVGTSLIAKFPLKRAHEGNQ